MLAKKHEYGNQLILAVCDEEHLGQTFEDGKINFRVSEKFFNGNVVSEEKLIKLFEEATSINLFGNKCVNIAEKQGLINKNTPIIISGIKHVQIYLV